MSKRFPMPPDRGELRSLGGRLGLSMPDVDGMSWAWLLAGAGTVLTPLPRPDSRAEARRLAIVERSDTIGYASLRVNSGMDSRQDRFPAGRSMVDGPALARVRRLAPTLSRSRSERRLQGGTTCS